MVRTQLAAELHVATHTAAFHHSGMGRRIGVGGEGQKRKEEGKKKDRAPWVEIKSLIEQY